MICNNEQCEYKKSTLCDLDERQRADCCPLNDIYILDKLNKLSAEIGVKQQEYDNLLRKEMDKFKGKFFKKIEQAKVVKIHVYKIETTYWDNAIDYTRSFYCKDEQGSWFEIDEKLNFNYDYYDLKTIMNDEEITEFEYNALREDIIKQVRSDELDKIKNKYKKLIGEQK
jgi:hypothetical protein